MDHSNDFYPARFRELLMAGPLLLPGTFYPFGALQIKAQGFSACYISGAAVSNSLGFVDEGRVSLERMESIVKDILHVADLPLVVDCDTGLLSAEKLELLLRHRRSSTEEEFIKFYRKICSMPDDEFSVAETVRALEKAGVAAIHIED